ncbi:MAG: thioredoxin fold domain-containing protein [Pseudomonadota bacterium]
MKPARITLFALSALAVFFFFSPPAQAVELTWHSYTKGLKLAKEQKKPLMINFYADWCGYCRKMDSETFTDEGVSQYLSEKFVLVKVNADVSKELSAAYYVRGLPNLWFVDSEGEKIAPLPGFAPPDNLMPILKFIGTQAYKKMTFKDFVENGGGRE